MIDPYVSAGESFHSEVHSYSAAFDTQLEMKGWPLIEIEAIEQLNVLLPALKKIAWHLSPLNVS